MPGPPIPTRIAQSSSGSRATLCTGPERSRPTDAAEVPPLCTGPSVPVASGGWPVHKVRAPSVFVHGPAGLVCGDWLAGAQRCGTAPSLGTGQSDPAPGVAGWCTKGTRCGSAGHEEV
jgi:hypothetical protein